METIATKDVLTLSVALGESMLACGAEIYRVEETVQRILQTYELEDSHVYVISNGIFASSNVGGDGCSLIRSVPLGTIHLGKIAAMNQLARDLAARNCSVSEGWERLRQCQELPPPHKRMAVLCRGIGCSAFCLLFGGSMTDALCAGVIGMVLGLHMNWQERLSMARFAKCLFNSMLVTLLSFLPLWMGLAVSQDRVVISGIIPLFPGIVFTTSVRELFNSDYLSGVIHFVDALLTALCIAAGVGIVISLC